MWGWVGLDGRPWVGRCGPCMAEPMSTGDLQRAIIKARIHVKFSGHNPTQGDHQGPHTAPHHPRPYGIMGYNLGLIRIG